MSKYSILKNQHEAFLNKKGTSQGQRVDSSVIVTLIEKLDIAEYRISEMEKIINETCPRSNECARLRAVADAAREYLNGDVEDGAPEANLLRALAEIDGVRE